MEWLGYLFVLTVLGYAMLLMLALPKMKAGHALLSAVCGMLFASYYGVIILQWMAPTAFVLMYGGLAGFAAGAVCTALNLRGLRKRLLSPGMLVFALMCAFHLLEAPFIRIQDHDAMSYWMRAVKELYTFDCFYIHADATMFHTDYIPLLASLQYSVVRVFGWQDAYPTLVTSMCIAASVASLAEHFQKRWVAVVMSVLFVYAYRLFGFGLHDNRADGPMLMVFTAGLIGLLCREDNEWSDLLAPVMACSVLTGFKIYSGLMFAAVLALGMFVEWRGAAVKKAASRKLAVAAVVSVVLVIALQSSWSVLYNYATAQAQAQKPLLRAEYLGQTLEQGEAAVSVSQLLSGNPRTTELLHSFTPEKIDRFLTQAGETLASYVSSKVILVWLFLIPLAAMCLKSRSDRRAAALKTVCLLVVVFLIYLAGLFGSYFVQAETAGAAMGYLATSSTPIVVCSLFLTAWLGQDNARALAGAGLAAATALMVLLCSPAKLLPDLEKEEYEAEAQLAVDFYEQEIPGLLTEADKGKRAMLIENSYLATEVSSRSGKTHAYAYFGLPVRVLEPVYYDYGDYTQLDTFEGEWLRQRIIDSRCELLILRVEDFLYWEAICDALGLYGDYDDCIGVYDVTCEDGELSFAFRLPEDYEEY